MLYNMIIEQMAPSERADFGGFEKFWMKLVFFPIWVGVKFSSGPIGTSCAAAAGFFISVLGTGILLESRIDVGWGTLCKIF